MNDSITKCMRKIFLATLAITHSVIASVSLQPSSASGYHYYIPKMDSLISGYGMGTNISYRIMRFEDIAFLNEAILEFNFKTRYIWPTHMTLGEESYPIDRMYHNITNTYGRVIEQLDNSVRQGQGYYYYIDITPNGKIPSYISPNVEFDLLYQVENNTDADSIYRSITGLTSDRCIDIRTMWITSNTQHRAPKASRICSLYSSIEKFHKLRTIGLQNSFIYPYNIDRVSGGTNINNGVNYYFDYDSENWIGEPYSSESTASGSIGDMELRIRTNYVKRKRSATTYSDRFVISPIEEDKSFTRICYSYSSMSNSPATLICYNDYIEHCGHSVRDTIASIRRISLLSLTKTIDSSSSQEETTTTKYILVDSTNQEWVEDISSTYGRKFTSMPFLDLPNRMPEFFNKYFNEIPLSIDGIDAPPDPPDPDRDGSPTTSRYKTVEYTARLLWSIQIVGINYFTLFDGM